MKAARAFCLSLVAALAVVCCSARRDVSTLDTPYGVHLAFGNGGVLESAVRSLWATGRPLARQGTNTTAACRYGMAAGALQWMSTGHSYTYTAGNFTGSLHEVALENAPRKPGDTIYYQCSSGPEWSPVFNFTLQQQNVSTGGLDQPWIAVICDMGVKHSDDTVAAISKAVGLGSVQAVVHGGDISYANDYDPAVNNAYIWQDYFSSVSHFAAYVPYMTCPGNHERQFDFAGYLNWLPMPNASGSPFYHSFDYMGVHFTMFSTEHNFSGGSAQHSWIVNDLKQADANRRDVPWVIVVGHRPLYCSDLVLYERCAGEAEKYRGYLEEDLNEFHVDAYINGHNHQYERSYPMYHSNATQTDYTDPKAPVYIVDGAAGCKEAIDPSFLPQALVPWRAHHSGLVGKSWLQLRATPNTLQFQLLSSEEDTVIDKFEIKRTVVAA